MLILEFRNEIIFFPIIDPFFSAVDSLEISNLRNLELYKIIGEEIKSYKLPKMYDSQNGIWLIGYDGEIKLFSKNSSMLKNLYVVIDSMAIRKEEKLNQNFKCK